MRRRSICLCISQFYPVQSGAERQALLQGAELVRRGHRVQVVTTAVAGEPTHAIIEGIEVHRTVRLVRLGPVFGVALVSGLAVALLRRRREFDLVHTHQAMWEPCATGLVRKRLARPVLVQPAASGFYGEMQSLDRTRGSRFLHRLVRRNDHFAAISDEIVDELVVRGVEASRITRTDSGVDVREFHPAAADGPDRRRLLQKLMHGTLDLDQQKIVVFAGRLHPQKNLRLLLEAWSRVEWHRPSAGGTKPSARLVLLGDGPQGRELEQLATELGCSQSVHFAGRVDNVADWLRAADVFVLPSVAEGSSNSLLEAMATGLPCLVSRIGGNVDMVEHEKTGMVIDSGDLKAWSEAILRVLRDRALARALGASARRWVVRERSIFAVVSRYEHLYEQLLDEAGG